VRGAYSIPVVLVAVAAAGACGSDHLGFGGIAGGGAAGGSAPAGSCERDAECGPGFLCEAQRCIDARCLDGALDGSETDVDCGGDLCAPCASGDACREASDCESGVCTDERCTPCVEHAECGEGRFCLDGACTGGKELGAICAADDECASGFCPGDDGVCCESACDGGCEACHFIKTGLDSGACAAVVEGFDPDAECTDEGAATCGSNGQGCNGDAEAPGCIVYPAGTPCRAEGCLDGQAAPALSCDGEGTCEEIGAVACAPFACDAAGLACRASCTLDEDCAPGNYCDGASCVGHKPLGAACAEGSECSSGFCPGEDGVCCDSACEGLCTACHANYTDGASGTCAAVSAGMDPQNECLFSCNGSGSCSL
jgi:hypothetical protein